MAADVAQHCWIGFSNWTETKMMMVFGSWSCATLFCKADQESVQQLCVEIFLQTNYSRNSKKEQVSLHRKYRQRSCSGCHCWWLKCSVGWNFSLYVYCCMHCRILWTVYTPTWSTTDCLVAWLSLLSEANWLQFTGTSKSGFLHSRGYTYTLHMLMVCNTGEICWFVVCLQPHVPGLCIGMMV